MIKLRGSYKLSPQDIRPQYQDPRLTIPGSSPNAFGGYGRMPGDVGGGYSYQPNQNTRDNFFSSLRSMFGQTSERPSRRYEGNPYSRLRERNKREASTDWRAGITRAPYVLTGDGGDNRRRETGTETEIGTEIGTEIETGIGT